MRSRVQPQDLKSCNPDFKSRYDLQVGSPWFNPSAVLVHSQLVSVIQRVDNAIHRMNHYPLENYFQNLLLVVQWMVYAMNGTMHPSNYWVQAGLLQVRILYP